jgi:hypothetical protein
MRSADSHSRFLLLHFAPKHARSHDTLECIQASVAKHNVVSRFGDGDAGHEKGDGLADGEVGGMGTPSLSRMRPGRPGQARHHGRRGLGRARRFFGKSWEMPSLPAVRWSCSRPAFSSKSAPRPPRRSWAQGVHLLRRLPSWSVVLSSTNSMGAASMLIPVKTDDQKSTREQPLTKDLWCHSFRRSSRLFSYRGPFSGAAQRWLTRAAVRLWAGWMRKRPT